MSALLAALEKSLERGGDDCLATRDANMHRGSRTGTRLGATINAQ